MDRLSVACQHAGAFPLQGTLLDPFPFDHHLRSYDAKLRERAESLFCSDDQIDVKVLVSDPEAPGPSKWRSNTIRSYDELRNHIRLSSDGFRNLNVPETRFVFIWAASSRDRLKSSSQVLTLVMTYHQVMPEFLDFLFPFGFQQYPQDAPFNDFKVRCRLTADERGSRLPALGHSGLNYKMCYGLKGVESTSSPLGPWSIRQASLYHCFDVETGTADWILIKGNLLLQKRLEKMTKSGLANKSAGLEPLHAKLVASLEVHIWVCDWASENWRWYLNYLEEEFQQISRQIYAVDVPEHDSSDHHPTKTLLKALTWNESAPKNGFQDTSRNLESGAPLPQPLPPSNAPVGPFIHGPVANSVSNPPNGKSLRHTTPQPRPTKLFKFADYMRLQYIKERANEAQLVLESNMSIIQRLAEHYESMIRDSEWPEALRLQVKRDVVAFLAKLATAKTSVGLHRSRAQVLLRTLESRTSILNGLLDYENTQETIKSTRSTERLTEEMHKVSVRTASQTALMLLIALVTVLYLPATFISTMMSTDIVNWTEGDGGQITKIFKWPALQMFLYTSLPLTAMTLAACGFYYWRYVMGRSRSTTRIRESATDRV